MLKPRPWEKHYTTPNLWSTSFYFFGPNTFDLHCWDNVSSQSSNTLVTTFFWISLGSLLGCWHLLKLMITWARWIKIKYKKLSRQPPPKITFLWQIQLFLTLANRRPKLELQTGNFRLLKCKSPWKKIPHFCMACQRSKKWPQIHIMHLTSSNRLKCVLFLKYF